MQSTRELKGQKAAIIGFNARPLACSVTRLGAEVYVSDYWGDDDLSACCHKWTAVLSPSPGERQREEGPASDEDPDPPALQEELQLGPEHDTRIPYWTPVGKLRSPPRPPLPAGEGLAISPSTARIAPRGGATRT